MEQLYIFKGIPVEKLRKDVIILWLPKPMDDIVTIREQGYDYYGDPYVFLNEGIIALDTAQREVGISPSFLIPIQSPEEGEEIIREAIQEVEIIEM